MKETKYEFTFRSDLKADFRVRVVAGDRVEAMHGYWQKDIGNKVQRLLEDSKLFQDVQVDVSGPGRMEKAEEWSPL